MTRKMRCIFDTNTLVSASLFEDSVPGRAFYLALSEGNILISVDTWEEIVEVINRKKFDKYLTAEEREEFLTSLLNRADFVNVSTNLKICRDAKDDKFLNLASDGLADYIITGDDDLLVLQTYGSTQILTAKDFLALHA